MSILLFGAGAAAFLVGALLVAFGIPASDFSFGNSLIVAGTTAMVGGMIIAALGVAVWHLQRIADALAPRTPARSARPHNVLEAGPRSSSTQGRVPFPQRPRPDGRPEPREAAGYEPIPEQAFNEALDHYAPTLPNPDEPPLAVDEEVSLSPRHPTMPAARRTEAEENSPPTPPRQKTYFDSMWPTEPKAEPRIEARTDARTEPRAEPWTESKAEPKGEPQTETENEPDTEPTIGSTDEPGQDVQPEAKFESPFAPQPRAARTPLDPRADTRPEAGEDRPGSALSWQPADHAGADEPRTVAILKSGVVDGMGYTLYVDGSIEAELPQGTLRFASINELRSHLEKTS